MVAEFCNKLLVIDLGGFKDILGIWIGESELSKFWLGILN